MKNEPMAGWCFKEYSEEFSGAFDSIVKSGLIPRTITTDQKDHLKKKLTHMRKLLDKCPEVPF